MFKRLLLIRALARGGKPNAAMRELYEILIATLVVALLFGLAVLFALALSGHLIPS